MRNDLQDGLLEGRNFQEIFNWDDAQLTDAIQRAVDALQRAYIPPDEPWHAIRFADPQKKRFAFTSLDQLNAEADLVSQSFYSDGLFRMPHEKNGTESPHWFDPAMVYNNRDPGVLYDFPTLTQEFLRFARVEFERRLELEAGTTAEKAIDLRTPSPPPMNRSKMKQLLRKQARQPPTAAQREQWKLKQAESSKWELKNRGRNHRRNTSSVESSPVRGPVRGRGRGRGRPASPGRPASLDSFAPASEDEPPATRTMPPLRSRFLYEFEIEKEDEVEYAFEYTIGEDGSIIIL